MVTHYIQSKDNVVFSKNKINAIIEATEDIIIITEEQYKSLSIPSTIILNEDSSISFEEIIPESKVEEFNVYLSALEETVLNLADRQLATSLISKLVETSTSSDIINKINEIINVIGGN